MYSELIVVVSAETAEASHTWQRLERRHGGELFGLIDVALIRRDRQGKSAFQMRWQSSEPLTSPDRRLAGAFAEAIFGLSREEGYQRLSGAGLDPLFMQGLDEDLSPGGSAFLIYVPRDSGIDTRRYLKILEGLPGDLYHTTFRPQVEEALLKHNV